MALSVTVLDLKGRRHVVKAGLNTSINQVLEDVCKKLNYSTSDYYLIHLNKKLDLSSTIRFSNLSNNAKLELVKRPESSTTTSVKEEKVTICFSISTGERFTQHCNPQQNLWEAVASLPQTEPADATVVPVCVYTRREIVGEENLKKTTFRSLGIIDGSALIRFFLRPVDQPTVQPHVEAIHIPKEDPNAWEVHVQQSNDGASNWDAEIDDKPSQLEDQINKEMGDEPVNVFHDDQYSTWKKVEVEGKSEISWDTNSDEETSSTNPKEPHLQARDEKIIHEIWEERSKMTWKSYSYEEMDSTDTKDEKNISANLEEKSGALWRANSKEEKASSNGDEPETHDEKIVYLDDQNSVLFSLDDAHTRFEDTLPDEFFDVTIADVRYLLADQKRQLREIEESPLQTRAIREAEYFTRLKKYPKAVIRINFPDRLVLQGEFKAHNTVKHVEDFVRNFLDDKQMAFYLYLTPPKQILRSEEALYEVPLVPTAIVHFGCNEVKEHYLQAEVLAKRSSFSGAIRSSSQIRGVAIESEVVTEEVEMTEPKSKEVENMKPEPSTSNERRQRAVHESKGAVPKWFSSGKK